MKILKDKVIKELIEKGHNVQVLENDFGCGSIMVDYWTDNAYELDFEGDEIIRERDLI